MIPVSSTCCFGTHKSHKKRVVIEVTQRCNLNCHSCHAGILSVKRAEPDAATVISWLEQCRDLGMQDVIFTGGEPLLHKDLESIFNYAGKLGLSIDLCSNGLLITKRMAEMLTGYLDEISISLDALDEQTAVFMRSVSSNRIIKGVYRAMDKGIKVHLTTRVSNNNAAQIPELLRWCLDNGISHISLLGVIPLYRQTSMVADRHVLEKIVSTIEAKPEFQRIVKFKRMNNHGPLQACGAGKHIMGITAEGYLTPCVVFGINEPEFHLSGQNSIRQIITLDKWRCLIEDISRRSCSGCSFNSECGKGCSGAALQATGKLGPDPMCWENNES